MRMHCQKKTKLRKEGSSVYSLPFCRPNQVPVSSSFAGLCFIAFWHDPFQSSGRPMKSRPGDCGQEESMSYWCARAGMRAIPTSQVGDGRSC